MRPLLLLAFLLSVRLLSAKDYALSFSSFTFDPGANWSEIRTKSNDTIRFVAEERGKLLNNAACEIIAAEIKFPSDLASPEERQTIIAQLLGTPESPVLQKVFSRQIDFTGAHLVKVPTGKNEAYLISSPITHVSGAGTTLNPPRERTVAFFVFDPESMGRKAVIVTASEVYSTEDKKPLFLPQAAAIIESIQFTQGAVAKK